MMDVNILDIVLIVAIMSVSAILGGAVQRKTMFIWPHDVFTLVIVIFVIADVILRICPWDYSIYIPIIVGYFIGYAISSRKRYIHIMMPKMADQEFPFNYIVPYSKGKKWYIQDQNNKALLKRLIFGVEHEIITNVRLEPNFNVIVRMPFYYVPDFKVLVVDVYRNYDPKIVRKDKHIRCLQYTTEIYAAPASLHSKMELLTIENAHELDIQQNIRLQGELSKAKNETYRHAIWASAQTINYALCDAKPGIQLANYVKKSAGEKTEENLKKRSWLKSKRNENE